MYLIITNKRDLTSDLIVLEFQRRGLPYARMNTEDVPQGSIFCNPLDGSWQIDSADFSINGSDVKAAYFRRPGMPEPISAVEFSDERTYCTAEWFAILQAFYWDIGDRWLNSPHAIAQAENKIRQLSLAKKLGFLIPRTIVTNDSSKIAPLLIQAPVIGKPLRSALIKSEISERAVFTSRITCDDQISGATKACPFIVQDEIKKKYDLRITVVGHRVFSTSINSQTNAETQVDWRKSSRTDLAHDIYTLPNDIQEKCIYLTKSLGLRFGAIDLVLDEMGQHWFLEINPNGQWGWIEKRTDHPISSAIVDELENVANNQNT